MKYYSRILYIIYFLFSISLVSCIDEDSYCPSENNEIRIYFTYPLADENEAGTIIAAEQIDLFIFDEKGKFVKKHIDNIPGLTSGYYMTTDLEPGKYIFVSWVNLKDCYTLSHPEIPENTTIDELFLHLQTDINDTIATPIHTLYFGNLLHEEIKENHDHSLVVPLVRNTYNLTVKTRNLQVLPDHNYYVVVSDKNGSYSFDNSITSLKEVHYKSECIVNENTQLYGSLSALRLNEDEKYATLKLRNATTGLTIYERNLVEMVEIYRQQGMDIDFDTMFDFEIILGFETNSKVTVTINGWTLIEDEEELR